MEPVSQVLSLARPAWLVAHSDPVIESMIDDFSDAARDATRQLYWRFLADEVREARVTTRSKAWTAFDRANVEMLRRNRERREAGQRRRS